MIQNDVFERRGENTISNRLFYGLLFLFIYTGLVGAAITAHIAMKRNYEPSLFDGFLFCFTIPALGVGITSLDRGFLTSFIGYNIVVIPFGFILEPIMRGCGSNYAVRDIYSQTILVTSIVGITGIYSPSIFHNKKHLILATFFGLFVALTIHLSCSIWESLTWIQTITVITFSLYINYYLHRASMIQKTPRNSIDITSRLYLDVVMFFLNLLITNDQKQTRSGY